MPDITVPEPEKEAKPILHDTPKPTLPCGTPVAVPAMITHYSRMDYLYMGVKRATKTALYLGAVSAAVAGAGVMFGAPFILAFEGAAIIVGAGSLAMGAAKIREEKVKSEGGTPISEKVACIVIAMIVTAIKAWQKKKK